MNRLTKIMSMILVIILCLSVVTSCGPNKVGDDINKSKTQIYIGVATGGLTAKDWLKDIKTAFEEKYADYKIGDKTGIQIVITDAKYGKELLENYNTLTNDIIFTEDLYLYNWLMDSDAGFVDISDIVTEKVNGVSIEDTLDSAIKEYYAQYDENGVAHYSVLPYASAFNGFVYDSDLWFERGVYITKAYEDGLTSDMGITPLTEDDKVNGEWVTLVTEGGVSYYKTSKGDYLSKGPDGEYGTYDDGTPATIEQFFLLCDHMKNNCGVTPIYYSGKHKAEYLNWLLSALSVFFDGENIQSFYTQDGGIIDVIEQINSDGTYTTKEVSLTSSTYMEAYQSAGKYEALLFLEELISDANGYCGATSGEKDQYYAQREFMKGRWADDGYRYGFLVEGTWWENESAGNYAYLVENGGEKYAQENRNFKFLAFPHKSESDVGTTATYVNMVHSGAFILDSTDESKIDICKKFLQECFSAAGNASYTEQTSIIRPYSYTIDTSKLSSFGLSVYESIYANENAVVVYPVADNTVISEMDMLEKLAPRFFFRTKANGTNYLYAPSAMFEKKDINSIFDGLGKYGQ